jgi:predicted dehydrogenase
VVPPNYHERIVDVAIAHGVDILCEKPIADTMEASARIASKVKAAGRKMAVTMSHRFDQDKTTLRSIIRSGQLGKVNTVSCRYMSDLRAHMAWGALFRHTMQDPLMIEGAVHHLDLVADLAGARCQTIYASTWKPSWAEYAGDTDGIVVMTFENGARGIYEGSPALRSA